MRNREEKSPEGRWRGYVCGQSAQNCPIHMCPVFLAGTCGGTDIVGYLIFTVFLCISNFILLNLVMAVLMQELQVSFSCVCSLRLSRSLSHSHFRSLALASFLSSLPPGRRPPPSHPASLAREGVLLLKCAPNHRRAIMCCYMLMNTPAATS